MKKKEETKRFISAVFIFFLILYLSSLSYKKVNEIFLTYTEKMQAEKDSVSIIENQFNRFGIDDYKTEVINDKEQGRVIKIKIYANKFPDDFSPVELKREIRKKCPAIRNTENIKIEFIHKMEINNDKDVRKVKKYLNFYENLR